MVKRFPGKRLISQINPYDWYFLHTFSWASSLSSTWKKVNRRAASCTPMSPELSGVIQSTRRMNKGRNVASLSFRTNCIKAPTPALSISSTIWLLNMLARHADNTGDLTHLGLMVQLRASIEYSKQLDKECLVHFCDCTCARLPNSPSYHGHYSRRCSSRSRQLLAIELLESLEQRLWR